MGRKHRSSSLGQAPKPPTPSSAAAPSPAVDLAACRALAERFVHERDSAEGRTALHRAVEAASASSTSELQHSASSTSAELQHEEEKLDGLFLLDSLPMRMRELDEAGGKKQRPSHLHKLLLASDDESGYTPLHSAILRRDFLTLLVLLKHASTSATENGNGVQMLHPLRLLAGNLAGDNSLGEQSYGIMNDLAASMDHEGLSPLHLLGQTSAPGLDQCRRTLVWKSLRKMWKKQGSPQPQQSSSDGEENPPMYRRRMISFGNDQDLDYDIEAEDSSANQERRGRGGSFDVNLDDGQPDDDEDVGRADGGNNDLIPLEGVDFNALGNDGANQQTQRQRAASGVKQPQHSGVDYGCEVLTFGRADHCALGVPQFASGRLRERGEDAFSSASSTTSYKPKRVETFALGELRRDWSSDPNRESSSAAGKRREKDAVDSPAVAVAAAAHHTLVSTRSGQLFSFGLGKGGRLGTGDENHRPLPTRIMGPLTKRIVASIAAAENHSLCSTSDGAVYAWGSNGFGQLGIMSSSSRDVDAENSGSNSRLSPRRVEGELKQSFVVAVAAGDRHSVALTKLGEVYCWGDNRSGQLGTYSSTLGSGGSSPTSPASQVNSKCCHQPQRVEGLWSAQLRRKAIAVAAAEFSTLVLTMPPIVTAGESSLASLPTNTVYGWGHGNHSPMRVVFPSPSRQDGDASAYSRSICINPTAIACARHHSVAITADGRVYTWGLHSDSLGIEKSPSEQRKTSDSDMWATASEPKQRPRSNSQTSSAISSPQLVVGMLPEQGGGKAVAVSASESHTAVVTADGHLFTWGTSHGNYVMGHKGVRWQPSPRKVHRVHRAVGVAAAKEHTALLMMGTSFPSLPFQNETIDEDGHRQPLSLQESAAVEISRNVDMFNVIPVALVAHRLNCRPLLDFCDKFVRANLDGVLAVANKSDFATFLSSRTFVGTTRNSGHAQDGIFHPFLYRLANTQNWIDDGRTLFERYAGSMRPRARKARKAKRAEQRPTPVTCKEKDAAVGDEAFQTDVVTEKRTPLIGQGESVGRLTAEGQPEPQSATRKPFQEPPQPSKKTAAFSEASSSKYHCSACGVSCPDSDSYTLHINGRKHRNRLHAKAKEEEKSVAESMMAMKRMQLMEGDGRRAADQAKPLAVETPNTKKSVWGTPKPGVSAKASTAKKSRSKSFQDILSEEQSGHTTVSSKRPALSSAAAATASFPAKSPRASSLKKPSLANSGSPLPLSAFMKKSGGQKQDVMGSVGASWEATPKKSATSDLLSWGAKLEPMPHVQFEAKSFAEIQQEEARKEEEAAAACRIDGNQWFVQQRERAASIGEIQEQERLVEEQKMIEEQIMRRVEEEKKAAADAQKKRQGRRKQQGRQQKKTRPKRTGGGKQTKEG
ncbi:hypothetical protein ACHAXT_003717 [Thalassiosira profunda]